MDSERARCRRTDGKKWRCSRDVVPEQKYCERHMHRGRRSRKHVEASVNILQSDTTTNIKFSNSINTNSSASISNCKNLQLAASFANSSKNRRGIVTSSMSGYDERRNNIDVKNDLFAAKATIDVSVNRDTTTTSINATADKGNSRNNGNCIDAKNTSLSHMNDWSNNRRNNGSSTSFVAPEFGFSSRSVIQGCSNSGFDLITGIETELQRCKRTDGKKWQCSRNVVPDQKYCEMHMHRGSKKLMVAASKSPTVPKKINNCIDLNTNLSISTAASPHEINNDQSISTGSSSDATTITDEYTFVSCTLVPSP